MKPDSNPEAYAKIRLIITEQAQMHFERYTNMSVNNKLGLTTIPQSVIDSENARGMEAIALLSVYDELVSLAQTNKRRDLFGRKV